MKQYDDLATLMANQLTRETAQTVIGSGNKLVTAMQLLDQAALYFERQGNQNAANQLTNIVEDLTKG